MIHFFPCELYSTENQIVRYFDDENILVIILKFRQMVQCKI